MKSRRWRKSERLQFWGMYTLLFAVVCLLAFSWFYLADRTLIWKMDGWLQHYKAMVYYAQYLRDAVKTVLFEHSLDIPNWEFALGEGNDILSALHYYVIGDPFAVLCVLVPTRYMYVYYDAMIILRLYCAGAAFLMLGREMGYKNRYGLMAGALVYVFCFWNLFNVNRHPYFLNPLVYFPLLILGVEKILKGKKPYIFTVAVFVSAVSNFYFFYMLVLLTVIYVVVRLVTKYRRDLKTGLCRLARIAVWSVVGAAMGAVILLPICYTFLSDARSGMESAKHLFYPLSYYTNMVTLFFANNSNSWLCMGFAVPALFTLLLILKKRNRHGFLKLLFLICMVISVFPFLGQILNGFTYISNRWSWAFALLIAYMVPAAWNDLMHLRMKDGIYLFFCLAVLFAASMLLEYARDTEVLVSLCLALFTLFLLLPIRDETGRLLIGKNSRQKIAMAAVICSIVNNAFWFYSSGGDDYASQALDRTTVESDLTANETRHILDVAVTSGVTDFYRYSGSQLVKNTNLLAGMSSTQYYWSLSNPSVTDYRRSLDFSEAGLFNYIGYDGRAAILSLSSVKYYVVQAEKTSTVPYGFTFVRTIDLNGSITEAAQEQLLAELGTEELTEQQFHVLENDTAARLDIYESQNNLPLAYTYSAGIDRESWDAMSSVEKQEAMLQALVLEEDVEGFETKEIQISSEELEYSVTCSGSGVTLEENNFVVTQADSEVVLKFEGLENSETYVEILGLDYTGTPEYDLYFGDDSVDPLKLYNEANWNLLTSSEQESLKKQKRFWEGATEASLELVSSSKKGRKINYETKESTTYNGKHDYLVNMGYDENAVTYVKITFPQIGTYTFDEINVSCQPMDQFETQIAALAENVLEQVEIGNDTVTGTITLETPKMLCFSIPYSKGWTAYVDGEEVPLYQANVKNMAVYLDAGSHEVELHYETPLLAAGCGVSVLGGLVFLGYAVYDLRRKQKRKK